MAKKSFKGGLGSFIQESLGRLKKEDSIVDKSPTPPVLPQDTKGPSQKKGSNGGKSAAPKSTDDLVNQVVPTFSDDGDESYLKVKVKQQDEELLLWRTGKLNIEEFHKTLKEFNLRYIEENNSFEEI